MSKATILAAALSVVAAEPSAQAANAFKVLYYFQPGGEPANPVGAPLLVNGQLYGQTFQLAYPFGPGSIFSTNLLTGATSVVSTFPSASMQPQGPFIASGGTFFGIDDAGVYSFGAAAGFTSLLGNLLPSGGYYKLPTLVLSGTTLYGSACNFDINNYEFLYSVSKTGSRKKILYTFGGSYAVCPISIAIDGTTLYGVTYGSGNTLPQLFSMDLTKTLVPTPLYTFTNNPGSAASFILADNGVVYGFAQQGGAAGYGFLFSYSASAGFVTLHDFANGNDGAYPKSLLLRGHSLYGTTSAGGNGTGNGTVFEFNLQTGKETVLHSFSVTTDGADPTGIVKVGNTIYGTTQYGGPGYNYPTNPGYGTVFSVVQ